MWRVTCVHCIIPCVPCDIPRVTFTINLVPCTLCTIPIALVSLYWVANSFSWLLGDVIGYLHPSPLALLAPYLSSLALSLALLVPSATSIFFLCWLLCRGYNVLFFNWWRFWYFLSGGFWMRYWVIDLCWLWICKVVLAFLIIGYCNRYSIFCSLYCLRFLRVLC